MIQNLATQDQIKELNDKLDNLENVQLTQSSSVNVVRLVAYKFNKLLFISGTVGVTSAGNNVIATLPSNIILANDYTDFSISSFTLTGIVANGYVKKSTREIIIAHPSSSTGQQYSFNFVVPLM